VCAHSWLRLWYPLLSCTFRPVTIRVVGRCCTCTNNKSPVAYTLTWLQHRPESLVSFSSTTRGGGRSLVVCCDQCCVSCGQPSASLRLLLTWCVCVCVCVLVCVCVCVCVLVHMCMCVCTCLLEHACVCLHAYLFVLLCSDSMVLTCFSDLLLLLSVCIFLFLALALALSRSLFSLSICLPIHVLVATRKRRTSLPSSWGSSTTWSPRSHNLIRGQGFPTHSSTPSSVSIGWYAIARPASHRFACRPLARSSCGGERTSERLPTAKQREYINECIPEH
jgi:hypothetical protein